MKKLRILFLAIILLLTGFCSINATTLYVNHSASGSNNGSSWTNAYTSLQLALSASASGDEVWVAKGTYYPSQETDGTTDTQREYSFQMVEGVAIYGGFAGTETAVSLRTDYGHDKTNETTLSGDFNGDDIITGSGPTLAIANNSENAYHVFHHLSTSGLTASAVLDGFTIVGGNANGSANPWDDGGAIYNRSGQTPTINNCYFTGNSAIDNGGAIMNIISAHATITNCTFASNYAEGSGGAMGNYDATNASITNCLFYGNRAKDENGGGLYNYQDSNPTVTNCTFTKNSSKSGGGIYNSANSDITIVNSIIYGNTITTGWGTQIRNYTNSDLNLSYSDTEAGGINNSDGGTTTSGGGNIESNPLFVDSGDYPYLIFGVSPCVDAGNNAVNSQTYDIRGSNFDRKLDKTNGDPGIIDMGAYEYKFGTDPLPSEITWNGSQDLDWNTAVNWNDNAVPTATDDVLITNGNHPVIATDASANCNNLTVETGATLTIESTSGGTGSLIINGDATGDVTVKLYLAKDVWHYISGQTDISGDFTSVMGLTAGAGNDEFYRWDEVLETDNTPGTWVDILNGPTGNGSDTEMDEIFVACRGYAVTYKNNNKTLSLIGAPYTVNKVINITNTPTGTNSGSNLVGNPFTSTIAINNDAQTENFINQNASVLADNKQAIYLWDESSSDYVTIANGIGEKYIAPGQGFMIVAKNLSEYLEFNENIRKHGAAPFYKSTNGNVPRMELSIKDSENRRNNTTISFLPNMTLGLDPSYDAGKLKGNPNIALYTRLVEDNGVDFALQALPNNDIESMVIPVGVDVIKEIICEFSIKPDVMEGYPVYLLDTKENTVTNLKQNSYSALVSESGVGRFYLHFKEVLGVDEPTTATQLIQAWTANNTIYIFNEHNLCGTVKVVNMYGQSIVNTKLTGDVNQHIEITAPSGYYIVNIITNKGVVNKKVYLR